MRILEFQAQGLSDEDARRLRRSIKRTPLARVLMWTVVIVAFAYTTNPIAVWVFNRPGRITIASVSENPASMFIAVNGTVQNPRVAALAVSVNDRYQMVSVEQGVYVAHVPLVPGENRIVASLGRVSSNVIRIMRESARTVMLAGQRIAATRVLVMADNSGSMREGNIQERLTDQLARLQAAGISIDQRADTLGFGVDLESRYNNLIHSVERVAESNRQADAIYFFSDFDFQDDRVDKDTEAGFVRLRDLLRDHGLRIYLSSVKSSPSEKLLRIAEETGGRLIKDE